MDQNVSSDDTNLSYPESIDRTWRGEAKASDALVSWVRRAFDSVAARPLLPRWALAPAQTAQDTVQGSQSSLRQVAENTEEWNQLSVDESLWAWIRIASHDEDIARVYGTSERLYDDAFFALMYEAFDFLNDLLRRMQAFDETAARSEAQALWTELGSGTETYEVGAIVYNLAAQASEEAFGVGTGVQLHRANGEWAAQRFGNVAEIPDGRWAVEVQVTREREPLERWTDPYGIRRREADDEAITNALLALRLIHPSTYITSLPYRIGTAGYHKPPERVVLSKEGWSLLGQSRLMVVLSQAEVAGLKELGGILKRQATPSNSLPKAEAEKRDLALRAFAEAFERRQWRDRVVDLVEVLEALFGEGWEITYKVSMRAALILGGDLEHSTRVFRTVYGLYSLRSAVVHAGSGVPGSAKKVIEEWRGSSAVPKDPNACGAAAAAVGLEIVSAALCALLRLSTQVGYRPFEKDFKKERIDPLAFSEEERRRLQVDAGVRA